MQSYNISIDIHKILLVIVIGIVFIITISKLERIITIMAEQTKNNIITKNKESRENMRCQYSLEKAKREEEHKKNIEILNLIQKFEDSNRAIDYENSYQLKKIEFKGTVFESCANYYEKSVDFMDCVRNILKNDLYK